MSKLYEYLSFSKKSVDENKFTIDGIFSTDNKDRHGDVVEQNWDLKSFKKNPVILNAHKHNDAVEVIGRAERIGVKDGKLQGKIKFAVEENPKAGIIFDLIKGGFLNTFSVGFIPKEFDQTTGKITKSELLEVSVVPVPANPEALILAKQAGIKNLDKLYEFTEKQSEGVDNESDIQDKGVKGEDAESYKDDSCEGDGGCCEQAIKQDGCDGQNEKRKEKKVKVFEETEKEIRYRVRDPKDFEEGSFRSIMLKKDKPRIRAVIGKIKGEDKTKIQSLRFLKDDGWTLSEAKKWVREHKDELRSKLFLSSYEKRKVILKKIVEVIDLYGELNKKVETRHRDVVRADEYRLINRAVRKLLKIKK